MKFSELNLSEEVQEGIEAAGFANLTPVQEAALPIALSGRDVAAQAQTGTGKTAAFLISIFNRIKKMPEPMKGRAPRALGSSCTAVITSVSPRIGDTWPT